MQEVSDYISIKPTTLYLMSYLAHKPTYYLHKFIRIYVN